jgi:hypothetical protein
MVNKKTYIKERIKQVADNHNISYKNLFDIIQMSDSGFKGEHIKKPIKSDALVYLVTEFPDVDLNWVLTGKEKKIAKKEEKEEVLQTNEPPSNYGGSYLEKYIELLEENRELKNEIIGLLKKTII